MSFIPKSVWLHETRILSGSMYPLIHGLNLHVQFLLYPLLTSICVAINFFHRLHLAHQRELNQKSPPVILAEVRKIYSTLIRELPSLTKIYLSFEFTFVSLLIYLGGECIFWKKCPLRLIDCVSNIELDTVD